MSYIPLQKIWNRITLDLRGGSIYAISPGEVFPGKHFQLDPEYQNWSLKYITGIDRPFVIKEYPENYEHWIYHLTSTRNPCDEIVIKSFDIYSRCKKSTRDSVTILDQLII